MSSVLKTFFFTSFALIAFAANSVLCRLALGEHAIGAASFTVIRLISGAVTLVLILNIKSAGKSTTSNVTWAATLMLFYPVYDKSVLARADNVIGPRWYLREESMKPV